jgi:hypothetical protein
MAFRFGARLWRAQRGATAITIALFMTVMIGMGGFVVDLGHVAWVQRQLQSSADSAALAGAGEINCCSGTSKAVSTATLYSSLSGDHNVLPGVTSSFVSGYPQLKCFSSTGVSCTMGTGYDAANGIVVKEQASIPMWFASIFGLTSIPVTATATAGVQGGPAKQVAVEIILDTTESMNDADSSCGSGQTQESCAQQGAKTLLGELTYQGAQVGLMTFPSPTTATVADDYNCSGTNPSIVPYAAGDNYQVVALGNDFKTSSSGANLNTSSNMVRGIGAGKTSSGGSCPGMQAPGGEGTYYGGAIAAAQANLAANAPSGYQKVIILLSDGDATSKSGSQISSSLASNQCAEGVTAAQAATTAGTWVYTVAYGSETSGSCTTDSSGIQACTAMQDMASKPAFFYADGMGSSSCTSTANSSISDLNSAFKSIGQSFGAPRLLPDNTT